MKKLILGLLLCATAFTPSMAKKTAQVTRVYVFGVAQMLTDTVCFMSSVQPLDGVKFSKDGLLNDRAYYSTAFGQYVAAQYGAEHAVNSLFFSKSANKAKKAYMKLRSKALIVRKQRLVEVPATDFQFKARTYDYDK